MKDIEAARFYFRLTCSNPDCRALLNTSHEITGGHVSQLYCGLQLSSPLMAGACSRGCRPTFSDCNFRTTLEIVDAESQKAVRYETFDLLAGRFYREQYELVCACERAEDEVYEGSKYPAAHGVCGRWLQPFSKALMKTG